MSTSNDDMLSVQAMLKKQRAHAWKILVLSAVIGVFKYVIIGMSIGIGYYIGAMLSSMVL